MPQAWNLKDAIANLLENKEVNELLTMLGEAPTPLAPPAKMAMLPVVGGKVSPKFVNAMRKAYTFAENYKPDNLTEVVKAFFDARHQTLAKNSPARVVKEGLWPPNLRNAIGFFVENADPKAGRTGYAYVRDNPDLTRNLANQMDTIAHEATHGVQHKRHPEMFKDYIQPEINKEGYLNHPTEIGARRGGATGKKEWLAYEQKVINDYLNDKVQNIRNVIDLRNPDYVSGDPGQLRDLKNLAIQRAMERKASPDSLNFVQEAFDMFDDPAPLGGALRTVLGHDEAGRLLEQVGLNAYYVPQTYGRGYDVLPTRSIKDLMMQVPATYNRVTIPDPNSPYDRLISPNWLNLLK